MYPQPADQQRSSSGAHRRRPSVRTVYHCRRCAARAGMYKEVKSPPQKETHKSTQRTGTSLQSNRLSDGDASSTARTAEKAVILMQWHRRARGSKVHMHASLSSFPNGRSRMARRRLLREVIMRIDALLGWERVKRFFNFRSCLMLCTQHAQAVSSDRRTSGDQGVRGHGARAWRGRRQILPGQPSLARTNLSCRHKTSAKRTRIGMLSS